jgi:cytochrome oxidase assembly protein ShyY1
VLVLADPAGDGLAAVHEKPDTGNEKHREYELTWYSLAATLAVLWAWYSFRREPE